MEDHIDKIEFLACRFDYHELSEDDKKLVGETIGSEHAYNLLRASMLQASVARSGYSSAAERKKQLMSRFKDRQRRPLPSFLALLDRRIPAYYSLILLLVMMIPFLIYQLRDEGTGDAATQSPVISYIEVPAVSDTVYVTLPADTVYRDKLVYQKVYLPADTVYRLVNNRSIDPVNKPLFINSDVRTSIADNKALNDLMISID